MKKMFFTAIVLVVFSSVSIANTIEIKEIVVENNETIVENNETIVSLFSCADAASLGAAAAEMEYENLYDECLSSSAYNKIYNMFMAVCEQ